VILNDAKFTLGMKSGIAVAKAAFNEKKNLFTSKLILNIRKEKVICYIWSVDGYCAENCKLRKIE